MARSSRVALRRSMGRRPAACSAVLKERRDAPRLLSDRSHPPARARSSLRGVCSRVRDGSGCPGDELAASLCRAGRLVQRRLWRRSARPNDSNVFIGAIVDCGTAGLSTLGQGSPCKDRYGSSFDDTIRTSTYPALVKALQAVRAKAPRAKVAILGYPWIMPPSVGCYPRIPVAVGDVPYVRDIEATLNDAVRRAAAATGVTYVDFSTVSEGHDACQPLGVRWIEPVLTGTNPVILHPNELGEFEMAAQTTTALRLH